MKSYTRESIDLVKDACELQDLVDCYAVQETVSYDCPFCGEDRLIIGKESNLYHCLDCQATGDSIDYLMTANRMTFEEAVETIAFMYEIELEESEVKIPLIDPNQELLDIIAQFDEPHLMHFLLTSFLCRNDKPKEKKKPSKKEKTDVRKKKKKKKVARKTKKPTRKSKKKSKLC